MPEELNQMQPVDATTPESPAVSNGTAPAAPVVTDATAAPAPATVPPQPQYLTKEEAANLIAEAVKQAKETGRREMQSEKDREVAAVSREKRRLEAEYNTLQGGLAELDPELKERLELQQYRAREKANQQLEAEESNRRSVEETINQFYVNLSDYA